MVYAPGCPLGQGRVIACSKPISTIDDVIDEGQALWLAESPTGSSRPATQKLAAEWGCVVLLANPTSTLPTGLLDGWAARVSKERYRLDMSPYEPAKYCVTGKSAITDRGNLAIPWPSQLDGEELNCFDILLATATKPSPDPITGEYPTARQVAEAWKRTGEAGYFRANRQNGFHTFQDEAIEALLANTDA
jgi:hypothetical protein